ncbi:cytochrome-c peroxidase [Gluconobacter sp. Gdi]|uniref:cytochrome-c peroxidase n=1 Tax=Gluconobacter sp. Gdi TaxID=2691888 RepID=UPI001762815D|nr:cytochrome c peroxidase [Gluconobacter sp. Gdi]GFE97054.1 di-heme enzyme [Gluconobacter sp. Gdi]
MLHQLLLSLGLLITGIALPAVATDISPLDAKIELGHRLFYDADLSLDGSMSCATCHEQRHAFSDGNPTHPGVTDEDGIRNVPPLANVGQFHTLTWINQHVITLEDQFFIPLSGHHPVEMGMTNMSELSRRLSRNLCYRLLFSKAFPEKHTPIDARSVAEAVSAFERELTSYKSPWDLGLSDATRSRINGKEIFLGKGQCSSCHQPPLFTDQKFHALSISYSEPIRTPSLRNVEVTAPYLHDGSASTLKDAILAHPKGQILSQAELTDLTAFLRLMTDQDFLSDAKLGLPSEKCPLSTL